MNLPRRQAVTVRDKFTGVLTTMREIFGVLFALRVFELVASMLIAQPPACKLSGHGHVDSTTPCVSEALFKTRPERTSPLRRSIAPLSSLVACESIYSTSAITCCEGGPMPFAMPRVPLAIPNISSDVPCMSHDP